MRLVNKVAIITGGASGIGKATSIRFAQEGAKVVVADVNPTSGEKTVQQIRQAGGEATFYQVDVTIFEQVEALVQFAVDTYGSIEIMFNNAGIGISKPILDLQPEDYQKVIRVNQDGVYHGIVAAGRKMRDLGIKGSIINTASIYGFLASPYTFSYHASKGAVVMMTKSAALELAPLGIRVTAVAPGVVETPIIQGYHDAGLAQFMANQQMSRRITKPEQIADTVLFLASDEASAVNGSVLMADEGYASFKGNFLTLS